VASPEIKILKREVKEYLDQSDERMIRAVHAMLRADMETDWWDETTDAHKASIERGISDMENGHTIPHEEMVKSYAKWLTK
jgi:predicted transcriptional regulator